MPVRERTRGARRATPEVFEPFAAYVTQRLADAGVWATTLFDEASWAAGSYLPFTGRWGRALRPGARRVRPGAPRGRDHRPSGW
jgi:hypothetical protein